MRAQVFRYSHLAAACAALMSTPSLAEVGLQTDNTLPVMVITANRQGTALKSTPVAISSIGQTTIEDKKAVFVGQLLNQTAGVYTTDLGNEQHMMSIRQPMTTAAVYQYLEDGLSIRPVGGFNHNALYELNLAGISGIEIIRGPASSLYGNNAVGGTVNFLTQAPSLVPSGDLGIRASSEGFRRMDASLSDTLDTTFGTHGLRLSAYTSERGDSWQDHAQSDKQSVTVRHDWTLSDQTSFKNLLTYNHLYTQMTGSLNAKDFSLRPNFSYQTFTDREVDALRFSSQLQQHWNDQDQSQVTLYYRHNQTDQNPSYNIRADKKNGVLTGTYSTQLTENGFSSYGLEAQHHHRWHNVQFTGGLLAEVSPTQAKTTDAAVTRDAQTLIYTGFSPRAVLRDYEVEIRQQAIYGQADWTPVADVHLVAGVRHDDIEYRYDNHLTPSSVTGAADESRHYQKTSPKFGAIWNITPQMDVYSNWSQGFMPPEVSSQYGANLQTPSLKEATFSNVDLGLRFEAFKRRLQGEVTLYRMNGEDELISYTKPDNTREPRNAGRTRHEGVEFAGRVLLDPRYQQRIKLSGSYARHCYQTYQPSATTDYSGNDMPNAPRWFGTVEYQIKPTANLLLSAEGVYMSRYWINDANTVRDDGHSVLNLRANYQHQGYEWFAQVLNAANAHYADSTSYSNNEASYTPAAPRTYLLGVNYHFGE